MDISNYTSTLIHPLTAEGECVLPQQFTYPFEYTPHPLSVAACEELKAYISTREDWKEEVSRGKMFGVLVVTSKSPLPVPPRGNDEQSSTINREPLTDNRKPSYLIAFSGLLDGKNFHEGFVPPVFDLQQDDEYFQKEDAEISKMPDGKEKSERSRQLQMWLFKQFVFLNAKGEEKDLCEIFDAETCRIPPSGAGECCAPKLLQYAYSHNLQPICMAEFWLGQSPKGEIRYEGEYYPACHAKCKPILKHMLVGLDVEENPLLPMLRATAERMRIIYDDDWIVAVDKPSGMLAVKGNLDVPSVEEKIQEIYPEISGPLIVHRLDMDTSGVMLIAKNKEIHKALQIQFYKHEIRKRYIAILDGIVKSDKGEIILPLSPDRNNRPRQMVNYEHGKESITHYEVISRTDATTRIAFYPLTGRTHQLRVHAAHTNGLGCPIIGDRLYGKSPLPVPPLTDNREPSFPLGGIRRGLDNRLHLHAESIDFIHPITGKKLHLEVKAEF